MGSNSFTDGTSGKELTCQCRRHKRNQFAPWLEKIPWRRVQKERKENEVVQSCPTLCNPMDYKTPGSSVLDFTGKSTKVGCHFLLQGIFMTQGSNPGLPHCRQTLNHLSHQGSQGRAQQPTSVFFPGESHGQRSLGYSPQGHKESHMTEEPYHTQREYYCIIKKEKFPLFATT